MWLNETLGKTSVALCLPVEQLRKEQKEKSSLQFTAPSDGTQYTLTTELNV